METIVSAQSLSLVETGMMHRHCLDKPTHLGNKIIAPSPSTIEPTDEESTMPASTHNTMTCDDKDKESSGDDYSGPHTDIV